MVRLIFQRWHNNWKTVLGFVEYDINVKTGQKTISTIEVTLFFHLHFPWLYGPWQQERVLKLEFNFFFLPKLKNTVVKSICDLCCSFWSNWDLDTFSPSKWPSAPQFCERYICSWQKSDQKWLENGQTQKLSFFYWPVFTCKSLLSY